MLSRIAESLYWIGRYVERAADTCRIIDVPPQLMVDDPATAVRESAATPMARPGMSPHPGRPTAGANTRGVVE